MRTLLALLLCFPLMAQIILVVKKPSGGGSPPAFVGSNGAAYDPFNTSRTVALTSVSGGSAVIVGYVGANNISSCSDDQANSYTVYNGSQVKFCFSFSVAGAATLTTTVTLASSNSNPGTLIAAHYSGTLTTKDADCAASSFVANISCTTGSTSVIPQLLVGVYSGTATPTAGSGFTIRHTQGNVRWEDQVVSTTGTHVIDFANAEATVSIQGVTFQ